MERFEDDDRLESHTRGSQSFLVVGAEGFVVGKCASRYVCRQTAVLRIEA
jgi:hypothetical protein